MRSRRRRKTTAPVASSARLTEVGLEVNLDAMATLASLKRHVTRIDAASITSVTVTDARTISREIRWKVAGTAITMTVLILMRMHCGWDTK